MEIKTSLVVTKYTRLKDVLTFDTFLQILPENLVWSGKHASYALSLRAPAIKWTTFHITALTKMVIGNKSIIPGTCKWARTSEVLHYLPAVHHIILFVHEHMHVHGTVGQGLHLFNMNPLNPE